MNFKWTKVSLGYGNKPMNLLCNCLWNFLIHIATFSDWSCLALSLLYQFVLGWRSGCNDTCSLIFFYNFYSNSSENDQTLNYVLSTRSSQQNIWQKIYSDNFSLSLYMPYDLHLKSVLICWRCRSFFNNILYEKMIYSKEPNPRMEQLKVNEFNIKLKLSKGTNL